MYIYHLNAVKQVQASTFGLHGPMWKPNFEWREFTQLLFPWLLPWLDLVELWN